MRWFKHTNFEGMHSKHLSASKYHWLNYDDDKFERMYVMRQAAEIGTKKHAFAAMAIELGIPLRNNGTTLSMYVNDAIGYRMKPEQPLVYSPNAFGTPDAISFREHKKRMLLRIHDLKTGSELTSWKQLECYDALFCLEYMEDPFKIDHELRIYQNDDFRVYHPDPGDIKSIMEKYKHRDRHLDRLREEDDRL